MPSLGESEGQWIKMADIGVMQFHGNMRTLLGSCIGVALYERKLKLSGLAHIVLPDSMGRTQTLGKYADTAIPETIRQMALLAGVNKLLLTAKIAGGANMFTLVSPNGGITIGDQNIIAVEKVLAGEKIPVLGRHLGGEHGRRMVVDVATGTVHVQILGQNVVQI